MKATNYAATAYEPIETTLHNGFEALFAALNTNTIVMPLDGIVEKLLNHKYPTDAVEHALRKMGYSQQPVMRGKYTVPSRADSGFTTYDFRSRYYHFSITDLDNK